MLAHTACICMCVGVWMGVGVWERETDERFCPQVLSWAWAGSYKKTGNEEWLLLWQKGLIPALAYMIKRLRAWVSDSVR